MTMFTGIGFDMSSDSRSRLGKRRQRQDKLPRLAAEGNEAVMPVERFRRFVLGINHQCEGDDFRA
jgi:hypothetical protein